MISAMLRFPPGSLHLFPVLFRSERWPPKGLSAIFSGIMIFHSQPLSRIRMQQAPRSASFVQTLVFTIIPIIMVVVLLYLAVFGSSGFIRRHRMMVDLDRVENRLEERQTENTHIQREIRYIRTNEQILRHAITEELLLSEPGSMVYRFDPLPDPAND